MVSFKTIGATATSVLLFLADSTQARPSRMAFDVSAYSDYTCFERPVAKMERLSLTKEPLRWQKGPHVSPCVNWNDDFTVGYQAKEGFRSYDVKRLSMEAADKFYYCELNFFEEFDCKNHIGELWDLTEGKIETPVCHGNFTMVEGNSKAARSAQLTCAKRAELEKAGIDTTYRPPSQEGLPDAFIPKGWCRDRNRDGRCDDTEPQPIIMPPSRFSTAPTHRL